MLKTHRILRDANDQRKHRREQLDRPTGTFDSIGAAVAAAALVERGD